MLSAWLYLSLAADRSVKLCGSNSSDCRRTHRARNRKPKIKRRYKRYRRHIAGGLKSESRPVSNHHHLAQTLAPLLTVGKQQLVLCIRHAALHNGVPLLTTRKTIWLLSVWQGDSLYLNKWQMLIVWHLCTHRCWDSHGIRESACSPNWEVSNTLSTPMQATASDNIRTQYRIRLSNWICKKQLNRMTNHFPRDNAHLPRARTLAVACCFRSLHTSKLINVETENLLYPMTH